MKKLASVRRAPEGHWVGDGFPVRSMFSYDSHGAEVSPFLLLDYAGPAKFAPASEPRGVGQHPHRGFETVTVVYQGEVEHRDTAGNHGVIGPGDVQWMTAAKGILHEEFHSRAFTSKGGMLEMVQLWVNLPARDKMTTPRYQEILDRAIPTVTLGDAGSARIIAGEFDGAKGPARTFTPVNLWDVRLKAGGRAELPVPDGFTAIVLVLSGRVRLNDAEDASTAELALFEREGAGIVVEAREDAKLLVMSGEPIDEPIVGYGPFVMNTREEIGRAIEDFRAGRILVPTADVYVPPRGSWARVVPGGAGLDAARLADAVAFAEANETDWPVELLTADGQLWYAASMGETPPFSEPLGPVEPRGGPSGVVLRGGRIVASWGDVERPQMTFSVAKSYLAILAGVAVGRGLIPDLDAPVRASVDDGGFDSAQNRAITWRQLLQQTSEWEGTLFDRPDSVDHNRSVGLAGGETPKGARRALRAPGTHWEYNDVRVNRFSLSLLRVLGAALPDVLRAAIMEPIGASTTWRWEAYRNAAVEVAGRRIFSVPGGSHWGGGLFVSTLDHARVGLLVARDGAWGRGRLLPAGWVAAMRAPSAINPGYGLMWWLNTGRVQFKAAPESSFFAMGAGTHVIWIAPEQDLVMVARWIRKTSVEGLIERVLAALD